MKNLIAVVLFLTCSSIVFSQSENGWLKNSYVQINGGLDFDQSIEAGYATIKGGYFVKGAKSVFGTSATMASLFSSLHFLDAKITYGRFLGNPENKNWNILVMSGFAYINPASETTNTRTGFDNQGKPIFESQTTGGENFGVPISVELHSNKINKSGLNIKLETIITPKINLYHSLSIGINLNTK